MTPFVVVIENPQEDPTVLTLGDVEVMELSSYPTSPHCDLAVEGYDLEYLHTILEARDRFAKDSREWMTLNDLARRYREKLEDG